MRDARTVLASQKPVDGLLRKLRRGALEHLHPLPGSRKRAAPEDAVEVERRCQWIAARREAGIAPLDAGPVGHAVENGLTARIGGEKGGREVQEEAVHFMVRHSRRDAVDIGVGWHWGRFRLLHVRSNVSGGAFSSESLA